VAGESPTDKTKPDAAKPSATGEAASFVGTPAVGTSKAAPAAGVASVGPSDSEVNQQRRRLAWCVITAFLGAWFIAFLRFFLPRTLLTSHGIQDWLSLRLFIGCRHQVATEVPHLGRPHTGSSVCDLRALYSPGLHS
jgi:hypothetical protein